MRTTALVAVIFTGVSHMAALCGPYPLAAQLPAAPADDVRASMSAGQPSALDEALAQQRRKNPTTARVLGIYPGVGHFYVGEQGRGALLFGSAVTLGVIQSALDTKDCVDLPGSDDCNADRHTAIEAVVIIATIGLVGFSIWDAGEAAERANARSSRFGFVVLGRSPGIGGAARYRVGIRLPADIGR
jgi:hypothetical protein